MKRKVDQDLINWKLKSRRKVLLLRGARQVGKTHAIRKLGESFTHYIEVNFEETPEVKSFFEHSLDPDELIPKLQAYYRTSINPEETLLFFDEIQECPKALASLRFFYEKKRDLHVVAAGSLLEFALQEQPSFGVGRIESYFLYPLSFHEFLLAFDENGLVEMIKEHRTNLKPIEDVFHRRSMEYLRMFMLIGGLPEVVDSYLEDKNISPCFEILNGLLVAFKDDFAKYKKKAPIRRINDVFHSIALQAGAKFKFASVDRDIGTQYLKDALSLLEMAGLVFRINHTDARGIPLGAQVNPKKFKVSFFDSAFHQMLMPFNVQDYMVSMDLKQLNQGALAEAFVGTELIKSHSNTSVGPLYYWHREARSSNAEVDYVVEQHFQPVPIEVKSGTKGSMNSMYRFLEERKLDRGIRISMENFGRIGDIEILPLYASSWI